jgi:hypothetical protein
MFKLMLGFVVALALAGGCKSSGDQDSAEPAGLMMSSDSAVCKQAMACCEKRVELEKGATTIEDINLMCSGVALAETDEDCEQFRQGYAASIEAAGKELPAECK